jgi:hypothetical protein
MNFRLFCAIVDFKFLSTYKHMQPKFSGYFIPWYRLCIIFLQKTGCAAHWENLNQTHLVTLFGRLNEILVAAANQCDQMSL